jgi:hypothetical protein
MQQIFVQPTTIAAKGSDSITKIVTMAAFKYLFAFILSLQMGIAHGQKSNPYLTYQANCPAATNTASSA